jgi:hypothetical protein
MPERFAREHVQQRLSATARTHDTLQSGVSSVGGKAGSFAIPSMSSLPGMGKELSLADIIVLLPPPPVSSCLLSNHRRFNALSRQGKRPSRNLRGSARSVILLLLFSSMQQSYRV